MAQFLPSLTPAIDDNGSPLAGAVWEFYSKGTTTPLALQGGATSATANGDGEFATLSLATGQNYRAVLKSSAGKVLYDITSDEAAFFDAGVKAALDVNSSTVSGATWTFYVTGTTTPAKVYADPDLQVSLGFIVPANANGVFPEIYLDTTVTYKAVLDVNGTQTTLDPVDENAIGTFLSDTYVPALEPSAGWDGTASSGFGGAYGAVPSDPTRTTAKPVCRLLEPDFQFYTDEIIVGVAAYANNGGTVQGGIDYVRFHYEGNTTDISEPALRTFTRYDGTTYNCLGYWVTLKKPTGTWDTSDAANLYIEAVPTDGTMQNRVIGPYKFTPTDTLHDFEIDIDNNAAVVAGSSYQDIPTALAYLKGQSAQNPKLTIKSTDTNAYHDLNASGGNYAGGNGRCLIVAETSATFAFSSYTSDADNSMRPLYGGIHVRGTNITFDCEFIARITQEQATTDNGIWLESVKFTNTGSTPYWRAGTRPFFMFVERQSIFWMTECYSDTINDPYSGADLARGCVANGGYNDFGQGAHCVIHCIAQNWNSTTPWQTYVDAITITGPSGATLSLSGGNETSARTFTAKESGSPVGTFVVGTTEARYNTATAGGYDPTTAGEGYFIQDVADWLNSLTGWTATVLDNTRRASAFSDYRGGAGGSKGVAFTDVDVTSATTFQTYFDVHTDFLKQVSGENVENVLWAFNQATDVKGQVFFVTEANGAQDWMIINNAVHNVVDANLIQITVRDTATDDHKHVVIAHNTVPNQACLLRTSYTGYNPDAYCLVANNVFLDLYWSAEGARGSMTIKDNVIDTGYAALDTSTGTVTEGTALTKIPGLESGDFTPGGELLTNLKTPVITRDTYTESRAASDAAGAVAI